MAKSSKSSKSTVVVKKKWVQILAPELFNNVILGESYLPDPKNALGRFITVSLAAVTGEHQKQQVHVTFEITKVADGKLHTEIRGMKLAQASVKRAIRRKRNKVTDSFLVKTKDKKTIRIKPLIITRFRTNASVLTELKKVARDHLAATAQKSNFEGIAKELISQKLQRQLSGSLKKVYPLSFCEIGTIKVEALAGKSA